MGSAPLRRAAALLAGLAAVVAGCSSGNGEPAQVITIGADQDPLTAVEDPAATVYSAVQATLDQPYEASVETSTAMSLDTGETTLVRVGLLERRDSAGNLSVKTTFHGVDIDEEQPIEEIRFVDGIVYVQANGPSGSQWFGFTIEEGMDVSEAAALLSTVGDGAAYGLITAETADNGVVFRGSTPLIPETEEIAEAEAANESAQIARIFDALSEVEYTYEMLVKDNGKVGTLKMDANLGSLPDAFPQNEVDGSRVARASMSIAMEFSDFDEAVKAPPEDEVWQPAGA